MRDRIPKTAPEADEAIPSTPTGKPSLLVLQGPNIGMQHALSEQETVIGRTSAADIQVPHESVSRTHVKVYRSDRGFLIEDLGSTNGSFVNDKRISATVALNDGDVIRVGKAVFKFFSGQSVESAYHQELYQLSTRDGLTKAYNKRYFLEALSREIHRCKRHGSALSVVVLDVDLFKDLNDRFGHLAGDFVLRELVRVLAGKIRQEDILARFGGEEFALILPETPHEAARVVCERLRTLIEQFDFGSEGQALQVTVSMGIHTAAPVSSGDSAERMIGMADAKLYEAKAAGRNCVR